MSTKLNLKALTKAKKIESPLAKYNSVGQLFCVLCNTQVKSEIYWTGHVNGKAHKENLIQFKKGQAPASSAVKPSGNNNNGQGASSGLKRPAPVSAEAKDNDEHLFKAPAPKRMTVDESKKASSPSPSPSSASLSKALKVQEAAEELIRMGMVEDKTEDKSVAGTTESDDTGNGKSEEEGASKVVQEKIPQGFFDDPKEDAKARGVKFKDPQEAEWELFVKEIASEDLKSNEIVGMDQEASAADRELEQIEEQMVQWQRVLRLEKRAEELGKLKSKADKPSENNHSRDEAMDQGPNEENDDEDDEDFNDELDWRTKTKR